MTGFSVSTLSSQLAALRTLSVLKGDIAERQTRVSTGLRINSADDNGSVFAAGAALRAEIKGNEGVRNNLAQAQSIVGAALQGATSIREALANFRKSIIDAESPTMSASDLRTLSDRFDAQLFEIRSIIQRSGSGEINLLDGSRPDLNLMTGLGGETTTVRGTDFSALVSLLDANSIGKVVPPPEPPSNDKFAQLRQDIIARVKETTGRTDTAAISRFVDKFIAQIGPENEAEVRDLGQRLLDSLSGNDPFDKGNRQNVGHIVDRIARGGNENGTNQRINRLIERLSRREGGEDDDTGVDDDDDGEIELTETQRGLALVVKTIDAALAQADSAVGHLASNLKTLQRQDRFIEGRNATLGSTLHGLVGADVEKESAQLLAVQVQRDLATDVALPLQNEASPLVSLLDGGAVLAGADVQNGDVNSTRKSAIIAVNPVAVTGARLDISA
jgi:flagellin-like hook-associated protein FlgL